MNIIGLWVNTNVWMDDMAVFWQGVLAMILTAPALISFFILPEFIVYACVWMFLVIINDVLFGMYFR